MVIAPLAMCAALAPTPAAAQQPRWDQLPRMQIERQYGGALRDTLIQRLRDPVDGTICYLYLPITAPHTAPAQGGFVQYGANTIGTISCVPSTGTPATSAQTARRSTTPTPAAPPPASENARPPAAAPPAVPR